MATILIVDDDPQFRKMLRQMLERAGHSVVEASNGKEGEKLYRSFQPCLMITDIFMPEKEGLETIMEIKSEFPSAKIIAMSGGGREGDDLFLRHAEQFGASQILKKPFERQELLSMVAETLHA